MKANKALLFKFVIKPLAGLIILTYLASCFTQYIHPYYGFLFTLLSLGFIVLFCLMLLVVIVSAFIDIKLFFAALLILLLGYKNLASTFALNLFNKAESSKGKTIKILSWNVNNFSKQPEPDKQDLGTRKRIFKYIKETNADIVCIQDNAFAVESKEKFNEVKELEKLGYKHHVLSNDYILRNGTRQYGTGIFSKYSIVDFQKVNYNGHYYESLLFADVVINEDTLRVFTTHLRSMVLHAATYYPEEDYTMVQDDTAAIFDKSIIHKLTYFDNKHAEQAIIAKHVLDTTKFPYIFCGDINSVPSSYVYHHISKGLKDVFLESGCGIGQSYCGLTRTLRIDVVLTTPDINSLSYSCPKLRLSDHYPIVATLQLP